MQVADDKYMRLQETGVDEGSRLAETGALC